MTFALRSFSFSLRNALSASLDVYKRQALEEAKDAGVEVLSLKCHVGKDRLEIIGENEP